MNLQLAILQHESETGLGCFETLLDAADVDFEVVCSTRQELPDVAALDGVIVLGGSLAPDDATLLPVKHWIAQVVWAGLPYLGICLGGELLAAVCGARIRRGRPEVGIHDIFLTDGAKSDPLFSDLPARLEVFGWHGYEFDLPRGAVPLAGSLTCTYQAFRLGSAYALQFHPEVRVDDLKRWQQLAGNHRLLADSGRDWSAVALELDRATLHLDWLAAGLLERWLAMVAADGVESSGRAYAHDGWTASTRRDGERLQTEWGSRADSGLLRTQPR